MDNPRILSVGLALHFGAITPAPGARDAYDSRHNREKKGPVLKGISGKVTESFQLRPWEMKKRIKKNAFCGLKRGKGYPN